MNFKIKLYLLSVSLTCLTAFAQNETPKKYNKKISETYKENKAYRGMIVKNLKVSNTTFSKGKEILICNIQADDITIKKIDSEKLTVIKENKFNKFFAKNFYIVDCVELNDKYFVFYSSWDGDAKKEQVFSAEIDFGKCEFVGSPKLLLQVDGKVSPNTSYRSYFNLTESFNKKSFAINYQKDPEKNKGDKKSNDIIGIKEFDGNLNQIFSSEFEMPYNEKAVEYDDYRLNNNGDFYWLGKVYHDDSHDDKKKKKDLIANFHFEIFTVKSGVKTIKIVKVEDKENVINTLSLFNTEKDFMVCGGTYSNGSSDIMDTDGYVGFKINPDGTIYDKVYAKFTLELIKKYETDKGQQNIDKVLAKLTKGESNEFIRVLLQDVYVCKNGDLVFIGEQKDSYYSSGNLPSGGGGHTVTFYKNIIAVKVKPNGNVVWENKIPKNEVNKSTHWHVNLNNSYYFLFMDNIHNINLALNKKPYDAFGGHDEYLNIVKISDSEGSVSGGEIFNNEDFKNYDIKKYVASDRVPFKISENEIIFEIYQTKNDSGDVMVKVNLD
ncbi:hypothetical protein [Flavobacterium aestivum]|uniref:hypothetical protein n=1 Tax=Flavobacterium aestivum TaxID=3003257 RepID=UPI002482AFAE|nr:hypothetical protein [Flavobacterium aestivum]